MKSRIDVVYGCYIEALIATKGQMSRSDLVMAFGDSLPTVTRHITEFRDRNSGVIEFDPSSKTYVPGAAFAISNLNRRNISPADYLVAVAAVFGEQKDEKS